MLSAVHELATRRGTFRGRVSNKVPGTGCGLSVQTYEAESAMSKAASPKTALRIQSQQGISKDPTFCLPLLVANST